MPTLHIICGLPCSGKTTLAQKLEGETGAVRFSPDDWITALLPDDYSRSELDRLRDPVEAIQWGLAQRLLTLGVNVIVEWGTWSRSERETLRDSASALGASVALHYLPVSLEELLRRVEARNADLPEGTFFISPSELAGWHEQFEAPDQSELETFDDYSIH